jgi:hypothetical protein
MNEEKCSPKTICSVWVTRLRFFHWASDEFQIPNPMEIVPESESHEPGLHVRLV